LTAIAGVWTGSDVDRISACSRALQALSAFGDLAPAQRSFESATFGWLGHSRISGPDCSPALMSSNGILLASDARIDNQDELRSALMQSGVGCEDRDLAALLLAGWEKWGLKLPQRIIGSFAVAIYDDRKRQLVLMRDALGQRPLFYMRGAKGVAFASMPSGLMAVGWGHGTVDTRALADELLTNSSSGEGSLFEGIERVRAGHVVVLGESEVTQHPYWQVPATTLELSQSEFVDAYRFELDRAVASAMSQRTGSVATHLSSGYDSSAVAATAARLHGPGLLALTSAPKSGFNGPVLRGWLADESSLAAQTAAMHQMRHTIIRAPGGLVDLLRQNAAFYQAPANSVLNMEWWSAAAKCASKDGAGVLLTGELGNLTINFGGVGLLADWLTQRGVREWYRQLRAVHANNDLRWRGVLYGSALPWLPKALDQALNSAFRRRANPAQSSFVRPEWRNGINDPLSEKPHTNDESRSWVLRSSDFGSSRKGTLAQHGVDERDPTADIRLVEFSLRLPLEQLLADGVIRPLARRALADRVPAAVLNTKLRGMQSADWAERLPLREVRDVVDEVASSHAACDLLDIPAITRALDCWPEAGSPHHGTQMIFRNWLPKALSAGLLIKWNETVMRDAQSASMRA
jgi:asparagine synthase (glutamine-hydrolysing)